LDFAKAAERLRAQHVEWSHNPKGVHYSELRITLYQHIVLCSNRDPSFERGATLSAQCLDPYSYLVLSVPFFHPVPLAVVVKNNPIASILAKTVPNRCQVRSLIDEIQASLYSHAPAREFLEKAVRCSLLGLFPGSKPPSLRARRLLFEQMKPKGAESNAHGNMGGVVGRLVRLRHHQTLFFALKDALVYMVNHCAHTLRTVLKEFHGWEEFCATVHSSMNRARSSLLGVDDAEDLERFEKTLQGVSKQKIRRLFSRQPSSRDFEQVLIAECERNFAVDSELGRSKHYALIQKGALRVADTEMPLRWLYGMAKRRGDTSAQTQERLRKFSILVPALLEARTAFYEDGSKTKLKVALAGAGSWDETIVDVCALASIFRNKRTTHWVRLPAHVCVEQIRALRRVYSVPNGLPLEQCPDLMGVAAVCQECSAIRSFLTPKSGRASNGLVAFGFSQSLVSDEDLGAFYCGRKRSKPDRATGRGAKTGRALRHSQYFGKRCQDTRLTTVSLIGRILVFRQKMYAMLLFFCVAVPLFRTAYRTLHPMKKKTPGTPFAATAPTFSAWTRTRRGTAPPSAAASASTVPAGNSGRSTTATGARRNVAPRTSPPYFARTKKNTSSALGAADPPFTPNPTL